MSAPSGASKGQEEASVASVVVEATQDDTPGKIPAAIFFEDVPAAVEKHGADALIQQLTDLSQKYRFWEQKFTKSRAHLEQKIPDVKRALDAVRALENQSQRAKEAGGEPLESHFELNDGLYVRASIPPTSTVCLWLGANVMVEYPFDEAIELLTKNLEAATQNLNGTEVDISFLRDQINTTDINLSQVWNHHIALNRQAKAAKGGEGKE